MIHNSQNLHSHTFFSDGKMTHRETLNIAAANGCSVVAFTDHDIPMPVEIFNELKKVNYKTKWISGIELSTKEGAHIIGLFVDPSNNELLKHCSSVKQSRIDKATSVAGNLAKLGFSISAEEVLSKATEGVVGKPHIVEALVGKPENVSLLAKYISEFEKASKNNPELEREYKDAKDGSRRWGISAFVYPLFLKKEAFIPDIYADYDNTPELDRTVKMIHEAGGVAILAHWHTEIKTFTIEKLETMFLSRKLDGAETKLGWKDMESEIDREKLDRYRELAKIVARTGVLASVSIDAHLPSDYEVFSRDEAFATATVGAIEKIIAKSEVSTKFSTLASNKKFRHD